MTTNVAPRILSCWEKLGIPSSESDYQLVHSHKGPGPIFYMGTAALRELDPEDQQDHCSFKGCLWHHSPRLQPKRSFEIVTNFAVALEVDKVKSI